MAKKYDSSEGIWRTIGGRRVFIKTGQSLSDAMKDSGKFKTKMNEKAVKGAREEDLKEQYKDSLNNVSKMEYNGEITKEEYDKAVKNINKAYIDKRNEYVGIQKEDKFYIRKDGTKEYDPYKGTRFEKKYDSVEDALNDPNHPTRKYIDEKLKVPRASGAKDFSDEIRKNEFIGRVKNNRVVENIKTGNKYYEVGNGQWRSEKDGYDYYIDFNSSDIDNSKYRDVASGRIINTNPRADNYWDYEGNGLKSKYKGTIDYLKQTTNMNGSEILELLKRIDEDKK